MSRGLLESVTNGRLLISGRNYTSQTSRNDFEHRGEKNACYFVIVNGSEESMVWVAPGSQNYMLYSDKDDAKPC